MLHTLFTLQYHAREHPSVVLCTELYFIDFLLNNTAVTSKLCANSICVDRPAVVPSSQCTIDAKKYPFKSIYSTKDYIYRLQCCEKHKLSVNVHFGCSSCLPWTGACPPGTVDHLTTSDLKLTGANAGGLWLVRGGTEVNTHLNFIHNLEVFI